MPKAAITVLGIEVLIGAALALRQRLVVVLHDPSYCPTESHFDTDGADRPNKECTFAPPARSWTSDGQVIVRHTGHRQKHVGGRDPVNAADLPEDHGRRGPARAEVTWVMTMRPLWWRLYSSGADPPAWPAAFCITMRAMPASRRSAGSRARAAPFRRPAAAAGNRPRLPPPPRPSPAAWLPALRLPARRRVRGHAGNVCCHASGCSHDKHPLAVAVPPKARPGRWILRVASDCRNGAGGDSQRQLRCRCGRGKKVEMIGGNLRGCVSRAGRGPVRRRWHRTRTHRWRPRPPGDRLRQRSCAMPPRPHPGRSAHRRTPPLPSTNRDPHPQRPAELHCRYHLCCCVLYAVIADFQRSTGLA